MTATVWGFAGAGLVVLGLVGVIGAQQVQLAEAKGALAREQRDRAADSRSAETSARLASENYRHEEQRRTAAHREALYAANQKAAQDRAGRDRSDASARRVQQWAAAEVAAARAAAGHPAAAPAGPSTADSAGVLADVLGRCVARVRLLATIADERGTAGRLCERSYDSLNPDTRHDTPDPTEERQ